MSPKQMVIHDCSNFMHDGSCLGVSSLCFPGCKAQPPEKECRVVQGKRCAFFERCIMPLGDRPSPKNEPGLSGNRQEARNLYLDRHDQKRPKQMAGRRNCPRCGTILDPGKKFCEECRKHRRNETARKNMQKWRNRVV